MKLQGIAIFKDELSDSNTADGRFDEISGEQWPPPVNGVSDKESPSQAATAKLARALDQVEIVEVHYFRDEETANRGIVLPLRLILVRWPFTKRRGPCPSVPLSQRTTRISFPRYSSRLPAAVR